MSQADYDIANQLMDAARTDLNLQLVAGVTNNSGATEPATKFAYMWWPDTTTGILKQRNAANTAWINKGTLSIAFVDFTSTKDTKLTGIESSATQDQTGAEIKTLYEAQTNAFTDTKNTKLTGIEASADITDTTNVTAAGALMDSEIDANLKTFVLPASTTISAFGKTLIDDAAASNARTTLAVQPTASPSFTGTLTVASTLTLTSNSLKMDAATANISLGNVSANTPFIDFNSSATAADYHARIIASGGTTVGTGTLTLTAATFALGNTNLTITGGSIDGRDVGVDGAKLDLIEGSATADQTGAEIKSLYQAQANAFTDTKNTKLNGISSGAQVNPSVATQALMEAAANNTDIVTPLRAKNHPGTAKAWVNFNGTGTVAIRSSYNVSSITDHTTGSYTVNFTTAFSSANYGAALAASNVGSDGRFILENNTVATASTFRLVTTNSGQQLSDITYARAVFFGDQ